MMMMDSYSHLATLTLMVMLMASSASSGSVEDFESDRQEMLDAEDETFLGSDLELSAQVGEHRSYPTAERNA